MRTILSALVIVGLSAPVCAQGLSIPTGSMKIKTQDQVDQDAERNKAYEEKLKTMPDQNVKSDPWGNMRNTGSAQGEQKVRQKQADQKKKAGAH